MLDVPESVFPKMISVTVLAPPAVGKQARTRRMKNLALRARNMATSAPLSAILRVALAAGKPPKAFDTLNSMWQALILSCEPVLDEVARLSTAPGALLDAI